jgi:hypothetical protein
VTVSLSRSQLLAVLGAVPVLARARPAGAQAAPLRIGAQPAEIFSEPVYVVDSGSPT